MVGFLRTQLNSFLSLIPAAYLIRTIGWERDWSGVLDGTCIPLRPSRLPATKMVAILCQSLPESGWLTTVFNWSADLIGLALAQSVIF
jgi:hypothetical protein